MSGLTTDASPMASPTGSGRTGPVAITPSHPRPPRSLPSSDILGASGRAAGATSLARPATNPPAARDPPLERPGFHVALHGRWVDGAQDIVVPVPSSFAQASVRGYNAFCYGLRAAGLRDESYSASSV